jgi:hypothetical protein
MNTRTTQRPRNQPTSEGIRITKTCEGCRRELHLVMDSTGSMWMHESAAAEHACFTAYRKLYETGAL